MYHSTVNVAPFCTKFKNSISQQSKIKSKLKK